MLLKAGMDLRKWFWRRVSDLQPELANCGEPSSQNFVCRKENDASRSGLIVDDLGDDGPKQHILQSYPTSVFGKRKRNFHAAWYDKWEWLEYSVKSDAAFGRKGKAVFCKLHER